METLKRVAVLMKIDPANAGGMRRYKDIYKLDHRKKEKTGFIVMLNEEYEAWYKRNIAPYYVKPQKAEE